MGTMGFDGRVAVVTGAGRGIGRAHALLLASRGASVVVNDLGVDVHGGDAQAGPAEEVVAEIQAAGGTALANTDDVSSPAGAAAVIDAAVAAFGRVDVLVHNAGRNLGEFQPIMDVHVGAGHWLVERAWGGMVERGHGRVVLTTSASGLYGDGTGPGPNPKQPYATAKTAVIGLTKALAVRGAPAGIKVNAISPTADTRLVGLNQDIHNTREGAPPPEATINWVAANAPARLVAAGALWLMHEDCPVSGRLFAVGAGRVGEIFIGVTEGYISPDGELEPEDVLAHLGEVTDLGRHHVPVDMGDYGRWVRSIIPDRSGAPV
ncbi:MAG: short-chain dehydrogenase/reductase [Actinomycetia bacterium]|nr:short-chain dehydrogenase/reductase [Actinomycetes bacterium]